MPELSDKAAYHFYRRLLFYYIDFMENKKTRIFADQIVGLLRTDREKIQRIYKKDYVATGDRVRMKLALWLPGAYYRAVKMYDRYVVPLRSRK